MVTSALPQRLSGQQGTVLPDTALPLQPVGPRGPKMPLGLIRTKFRPVTTRKLIPAGAQALAQVLGPMKKHRGHHLYLCADTARRAAERKQHDSTIFACQCIESLHTGGGDQVQQSPLHGAANLVLPQPPAEELLQEALLQI